MKKNIHAQNIGKLSGKVCSEKKAKSSRENGRLSGRPKTLSEDIDQFGVPQVLIEMARIGDAGPYSFWVYTEPLGNPSFHFKHKTDFELVLQMKDLKILEVKHNKSRFKFQKGQDLPGPILKLVQTFLKDKNKKLPHRSNEQAMDDAWKLLNE